MLRRALGKITIFFTVVGTLSLGVFLVALWSVQDALYYEPALQVGAVVASDIEATSFYVFDVETGTEITSKEASLPLPIASVAKLVTAPLFYKNADLMGSTTITWSDVNTYGDAGRIHAYEEYSHYELLFPLLLESSNDAAAAMLRVHPTLLDEMHAYVASLGLTHTSFEDTSGLSEKDVSTASELATIARDVYFNYPHIIDITTLTQFVGTHTGWLNNNPFVQEDTYKGGKHGYTEAANRTAVAFFDETLANGTVRTIGYIVLGSDSVPKDIGTLRSLVQKEVRFE